jgi:hypothetical protein
VTAFCGYFDAPGPDDPPDVVVSAPHDAEDGLYFFVPLPDGGAARVGVCQRHADLLTELFREPK